MLKIVFKVTLTNTKKIYICCCFKPEWLGSSSCTWQHTRNKIPVQQSWNNAVRWIYSSQWTIISDNKSQWIYFDNPNIMSFLSPITQKYRKNCVFSSLITHRVHSLNSAWVPPSICGIWSIKGAVNMPIHNLPQFQPTQRKKVSLKAYKNSCQIFTNCAMVAYKDEVLWTKFAII